MFRMLMAIGALLIVAGCAQPQQSAPPVPEGNLGTGSAEHWEVLHGSEGTLTAEIVAPTRDAYVDVACAHDQFLSLIVSFMIPTSSAPPDRRLSLAFDEAAPARYPLLAMNESAHEWAFGTYARWPAFWHVVVALKEHHSIEVIADTNSGTTERRMTLNGAAVAIDQILAACGNPKPLL
jgi:hypothetical protein